MKYIMFAFVVGSFLGGTACAAIGSDHEVPYQRVQARQLAYGRNQRLIPAIMAAKGTLEVSSLDSMLAMPLPFHGLTQEFPGSAEPSEAIRRYLVHEALSLSTAGEQTEMRKRALDATLSMLVSSQLSRTSATVSDAIDLQRYYANIIYLLKDVLDATQTIPNHAARIGIISTAVTVVDLMQRMFGPDAEHSIPVSVALARFRQPLRAVLLALPCDAWLRTSAKNQ